MVFLRLIVKLFSAKGSTVQKKQVFVYKKDLYFSQSNQLRKYSTATGKITTVLTFDKNIISEQMTIIGDTIFVLARSKWERESGLYRADTNGSSVCYLGSGIFSNVYFFKYGILAECIGFDSNGFQLSDQKIYEFGYGSPKMLYTKNEDTTYKRQILDGVLYRADSTIPGSYKVLKSEEGQILYSISAFDNMYYRCY